MVFTVQIYWLGDHGGAKLICPEGNRRTPLLYKKKIGRRVLIGDLAHKRLRSQITNQNRSASSRDDGETENDVFHAPRVPRGLALCLSG